MQGNEIFPLLPMRNQNFTETAEFNFSFVKTPSYATNVLTLTLMSTKLYIFIWNIQHFP